MSGLDCFGVYVYLVIDLGVVVNFVSEQFIFICEDCYQLILDVVVCDNVNNFYVEQLDGIMGGFNYKCCMISILVQDLD